MGTLTLVLLALGLAMDATAVSVSNGICYKNAKGKVAALYAGLFGLFQAGMPVIGFVAGRSFSEFISSLDHWIALILLGFIGGKMVIESIREMREKEQCDVHRTLDGRTMVMQAVATSIDALAVGVTFAFLTVPILPAVSFIGVVTFTLSVVGVKVGNVFGCRYKSRAELAGGLILVLMGLKILFEHLGYLNF